MIRYILLFIIVLIISAALIFMRGMTSPLSKNQTEDAVQKRLDKLVTKEEDLTSGLLTVYKPDTDYKKQYVSGAATIDSPYHSASIGKTFTASLTYSLQEDGLLNVNDPIQHYLPASILTNLFLYKGIDYKEDVTILHLLGHTSGAADYFEDPVTKGQDFQTLMLDDTDRFWLPSDLVAFTRNNQEAFSAPGDNFHYSDTGYILLGMILEEASGMSFDELLHTRLFEPLAMKDTYLMFHSAPANKASNPLLPITLEGEDLSQKNVLSIDWSGGGIVTTTDDLLSFYTAWNAGQILSSDSMNAMTNFDKTYDKGIYYSQGMMQFKLEELSFFLKGMSDIQGGVGASGTYMLYAPKSNTYYIFNLGSLGMAEKGIGELVQIMMIYDRMIL